MGARASGPGGYQGRAIFTKATDLLLVVGAGHGCGSQVTVCPPLWFPFLLQSGGVDLVPNPLNTGLQPTQLPSLSALLEQFGNRKQEERTVSWKLPWSVSSTFRF